MLAGADYYAQFPVRLPGIKLFSTSLRFLINSKISLLRKKRVRAEVVYILDVDTLLLLRQFIRTNAK